jgi:hypothetical protein
VNLKANTLSESASAVNVLSMTCFILKYKFLAPAKAPVSRAIRLSVPESGVPAHVADPGTPFVVDTASIVESAGVPSPKNPFSAVVCVSSSHASM